jgi:hypothetical protein
MAVARHITVPLIISKNHNEVELLLGQRLGTKTKRQNQAKPNPFQHVQKRGSHARQPTKRPAPLEEKETKPKALGQATQKKAGHYARPLVCVLLFG